MPHLGPTELIVGVILVGIAIAVGKLPDIAAKLRGGGRGGMPPGSGAL